MVARRSNWSAVLAVALFACAAPSRAHAQTVAILSAQPNIESGELLLRGSGFSTSSRVFLFVDPAIELPVVSVTPNVLRATFPLSIPTGTFLLLVYDPLTGRYGLFNVALRTAAGDALVDALGQFIGYLDAAHGIVSIKKVSNRIVSVDVSPEGFKIGGSSVSLRHFDSACTTPHIAEQSGGSGFSDPFALTLADGSEPRQPPYGTVLWVPNRAEPPIVPVVPACQNELDYYVDPDGNCNSTQRLCGYAYWPATRVDLGHYVPPFKVE